MNSNHMESKQKSIVEIAEVRQEKDALRKIVDSVFSTEIMTPRRYRGTVEARMVFSKILIDRGHTITSIGRYLNRNHATIIYYNRNVSEWLEQYPYLFNKYLECKTSFLENREPIPIFKERDMQSMLMNLQKKVEDLTLEKEGLKGALKKYRKFQRIVDLLHEKVRFGDEEVVYRRIQSMLNH